MESNENWSKWLKEKGSNISKEEMEAMCEKTQKDLSHLGVKKDDLMIAAKEHLKKELKAKNEGVMERLHEVL